VRQLANCYEKHLIIHPDLNIPDVCYTANTCRTHFSHRICILSSSSKDMLEKLIEYRNEEKSIIKQSADPHVKIAFLFTGQGSQYKDMGRSLYESQPVFRKTMDECEQIFKSYLKKSLLEILYLNDGNSKLLNETAITQPALFSIEYCLTEVLNHWGIHPSAVMGHSVGEYVAACLAGVFSLEDGLKLIADRGRMMQALPKNGKMAAVFADEKMVSEAILPFKDEVSIAAYNGEHIVISGVKNVVESISAEFKFKKIRVVPLNVSHAFHSSLMDPMMADFKKAAEAISFSKPRINVISNITGKIAVEEISNADYWVKHIRKPVRFAQSIQELFRKGYNTFVEIGPKPILCGMGNLCIPESAGAWLPVMRPGQDWEYLLKTVAELYVRGAPVNWEDFDSDYHRRKVILPTYPFQRKRYWLKTKSYENKLDRVKVNEDQYLHPLLGNRLYIADSQKILFQAEISKDSPAYLKDHRAHNAVVVPGAAFVEMAISAGQISLQSEHITLESVDIQLPLILEDDRPTYIQTILTGEGGLSFSFRILSKKKIQTISSGC
jgi:malonyl CoA-acyl carrier protein transacylase